MMIASLSGWWLVLLAACLLLALNAAGAEEPAPGSTGSSAPGTPGSPQTPNKPETTFTIAEPAGPLPANQTILSREASERSTAGIDNKIVTLAGRTHVVWQDSTAQGYLARVRTLDRATGQWGPTITLGQGVDNHARPCLSADSQGYLHVIIGGHNTPLQYLRSEAPNDSSAWTKPQVFGKGTYPMLVVAGDDTLVVSARPSGSGAGRSGVDLYLKAPGETKWTHRPLVMEKEPQYKGYTGYNASLAWGPDGRRLHFACDIYEGPGVYTQRGIHQAVVYMYSDDLGVTWRRSDGSLIEGTPYPKNLDVIADSLRQREQDMPHPMLRLAGVMVDSTGRPFVLYNQHEPTPGMTHLVTPDGEGGWRQLPVAEALAAAYPDYGALAARGAFSISADDTLQFLMPIAPREDLGVPGAMAVVRERVRHVWVTSSDGGQTFRISEPIPHQPPADRHTPTVEQPTGHHPIAPGRSAAVMYVQGLQRYPQKGEVIQNVLYFVDPAQAP